MTSKHFTRVLCAGEPRGSVEAIERMLEAADEGSVDGIALVGDLGNGHEGAGDMFAALARTSRPAYWVPGPGDAPAERYLRESYNIEVASPRLQGIHGTATLAPDPEVAFAGMGGELNDDPDGSREEEEALRYPRWEAIYRLKVIGALDYNELVMLFATPPAHKGKGLAGSEAVAELIGTYRPRLVVTGGSAQNETIGRSMIVAPGPLAEGRYVIADLHAQRTESGRLAVGSP